MFRKKRRSTVEGLPPADSGEAEGDAPPKNRIVGSVLDPAYEDAYGVDDLSIDSAESPSPYEMLVANLKAAKPVKKSKKPPMAIQTISGTQFLLEEKEGKKIKKDDEEEEVTRGFPCCWLCTCTWINIFLVVAFLLLAAGIGGVTGYALRDTSLETSAPTFSPTVTTDSTPFPTVNPTVPPTQFPTTRFPTVNPTESPTEATAFPSLTPTVSPTKSVTEPPTTGFPTAAPSKAPTAFPVVEPTPFPTTSAPTPFPSTPFPTVEETTPPTPFPTVETTQAPTPFPTIPGPNQCAEAETDEYRWCRDESTLSICVSDGNGGFREGPASEDDDCTVKADSRFFCRCLEGAFLEQFGCVQEQNVGNRCPNTDRQGPDIFLATIE